MILVDTSVWIDFLTGKNTLFRKELHELIENEMDIVLNGIIVQEILQGVRSDIEYHKTKKYLSEFHYIFIQEPEVFEKAADIYRGCLQKGFRIRKSIDCLIAAQALQSNLELFHHDRDFAFISKFFPLKIYHASFFL